MVQKQRYFKFVISASHCQQLGLYSKCLGNAIPDRFANPGISGLSLLNPGINPGIESSQIMAGYSWSCNRENSNNKDYKVKVELRNAHSNRAVKLHVSSLAHGSF